MSYRPRSRSRSPEYRRREYSPSRPFARSPPPSSRRFDDYPPPPRRYDDDRMPPPRRYRSPSPPPTRYDSHGSQRYKHSESAYPHHSVRDRYLVDQDDRYGTRREGSMTDAQWERGRDVSDLDTFDGHSRSRGLRGPSEPSKDVIFLGLDPELTEVELLGFLRTEHGASVESTKIVRDRTTGASKGFGFAQFYTIEEAERFISINYPIVPMPALYAHSEPKRVKIDFSGPKVDHGAPPSSRAPLHATRPPYDGMRDIGGAGDGQRVLLLRGLDIGTDAGEVSGRLVDEITRMVGKDNKEKQAEKTISRVVMIVDRLSGQSWGFAFVELVTTELASALLSFLLSPSHQPNGFLISEVPIAASFSNPSAFIPMRAGPLGEQYLLRPGSNGGIGSATIAHTDGEFCAYWHKQAGAVETIPVGSAGVPSNGIQLSLSPETRIFLGNLAGVQGKTKADAFDGPAGVVVSTESSTSAPALSTNVMQPIKIGGFGGLPAPGNGVKKAKKIKEDTLIPIIGKNILGDDEEDVDLIGKDTVLLSRTKGAHLIPPTSTSRKIAKNISKWNTKQSELAAPVSDLEAPPRGISAANAVIGHKPLKDPVPLIPSTSTSLATKETGFDFTDTSTFSVTGKVACLLCQRQFKSEDILRKHVAQSDLHKTNMADPSIREAGQRRKTAAVAQANATDLPRYRDRAAERREVFNQPAKPLLEEASSKRKYAEGPRPPSPPPPAAPPGADDANIGNQLLAKMGWTSGTGLGKEREGRVDPVLVQQFEERAGLGAAKGREAGKWSGPGGWQQRAQDMTKERFDTSGSK